MKDNTVVSQNILNGVFLTLSYFERYLQTLSFGKKKFICHKSRDKVHKKAIKLHHLKILIVHMVLVVIWTTSVQVKIRSIAGSMFILVSIKESRKEAVQYVRFPVPPFWNAKWQLVSLFWLLGCQVHGVTK